MSNLIDRDALMIEYKAHSAICNHAYIDGWNDAVEEIKNAPIVVEAEPVRHGHWIFDYEDHGIKYCRCSECNHGDEHKHGVTVPYCWFCGAKMEM